MIFPKVLFSLLLFYSVSAHALLDQYICNFGSVVKVSSENIKNPKPIADNKDSGKFTFLIESLSPLKVSYINLNYGIKSPVHSVSNGKSLVLIESNTSDNHFIVTIFNSKRLNDGYLAVMSFHNGSVTDSNDFYAQSIRVGRCH
jgi:hypothetical protein